MERAWTDTDLTEFIVEASQHTYADPESEKSKSPYRPGCEEYLYESGDWKYHDSYAWKKDGGGEELVYFRDEPVWVMNYYGFLVNETDEDTKPIYAFLHQALRERHTVLPVRGATLSDVETGFRYDIQFIKNEVANFIGVEQIYLCESLVYECYFHGGLVR